MIYLRNLWLYVSGVVLTLFWAGRVVLTSMFRSPCELRKFCLKAPRVWTRQLLWIAGVEVEIEGTEHLEPGRPQIVVANHSSWFDVFALSAYFPERYHYVAKKELSRIPVFGKAWIVCGHIAIDRSDLSSAVASLERAAEKIAGEDATIIMFPEGTRSRTGELQRFKKGAFMLALKAGVPVIPLAIRGSRDVMPKGSWLVRPGRIRLTVGRPISVEEYTVSRRDELVRDARSAVARLLEGEDAVPGSRAGSPDEEMLSTEGDA